MTKYCVVESFLTTVSTVATILYTGLEGILSLKFVFELSANK
jgi:hypothetical protein